LVKCGRAQSAHGGVMGVKLIDQDKRSYRQSGTIEGN
jgi:hypothetical protein